MSRKMKMCEDILEHEKYNNLIYILNKLRNVRVGIWGTGQAGRMIFLSLEKNHIHPAYFVDSDRCKIGKKYCKKCSEIVRHNNNNLVTKEITCVDCGQIIKIDIKDNRTLRCFECQEKKKKNDTAIRVKKFRENNM